MSEDELQTVIIMVGNVGSGKSTYVSEMFSDFVRVSQDVLGSKEACIKVMDKALMEGKSVVVDRVNFNKKQRSTWIEIARGYNVECHAIYLEVPEIKLFGRIKDRKDHETIPESMSDIDKRNIITRFADQMEIPTLKEGFKSICILDNT